jgi:DNA repair protein RadC
VALPSPEDYAATDRAKEALATIGVVLSDHIIIADGTFVSMADSGYL